MQQETLIDGMIISGPGSCVLCGSPLIVADTETVVMELAPDGSPISDYTVYRCKGICTHCGHKVMMTRWRGGYIPYSQASLACKLMEAREENQRRVSEINATAENPFAVE